MRLLLALAAAAPLFGQCTYTVSPTQFPSIAAGSGSGSVTGPTINVTAGSGCVWAATTNTSWLHVDFGQTGSGSGTVGWHADVNTVAAARTGTLTVAGQTVNVTQAAQTCSYTLTPTPVNFPVAGGPGTLTVQTNCTWTAGSNNNWIQVPPNNNPTVTGNGSVSYTVVANACAAGRSGSIGVAAGQQQVITQDGSAANFTFSPASGSYPATATDDRITVTTGAGCGWNAFSDVSWLSISPATASGSGNGAITIHLLANTSVARTGNVHINNGATASLYTVTQAAAAAARATQHRGQRRGLRHQRGFTGRRSSPCSARIWGRLRAPDCRSRPTAFPSPRRWRACRRCSTMWRRPSPTFRPGR